MCSVVKVGMEKEDKKYSRSYLVELSELAVESFEYINEEFEVTDNVKEKYKKLMNKYTSLQTVDKTIDNKSLYYISLHFEGFLTIDLSLHDVDDLPKHLSEKYQHLFPSEKTSNKKMSEGEGSATGSNKTTLICDICRKKFKLNIAYNTHMKWHRMTRGCLVMANKLQSKDLKKYRPFQCTECDRRFPYQYRLNQHMTVVHGNKKFICVICKKKAYCTLRDLRSHMCVHTGKKTNKCIECGSLFSSKKGLNNHHRQVHERETQSSLTSHNCHHCKFYTYRKSVLTKHLKSNHADKFEELSVANRSRKHQREVSFKCSRCSYTTSLRANLKLHMTIHEDQQKFKCDHCDTVFKRSQDRKTHVKQKHHKQGKHVCGICGKAVTRKRILQHHMKVKHDVVADDYEPQKLQTTIPCKQCAETFTRRHYLHHHMYSKHGITVDGYIPHKCDVCEKTFSTNTLLLAHLKNKHKKGT